MGFAARICTFTHARMAARMHACMHGDAVKTARTARLRASAARAQIAAAGGAGAHPELAPIIHECALNERWARAAAWLPRGQRRQGLPEQRAGP